MNLRSIFFRLLLAIMVAGISWLAFTPLSVPMVDRVWDKLNHAVAFAALAFAADNAFPTRPFDAWKIVPLLAYGIAIEVIQRGIPNRTFDVADIVADGVGLLIYGVVWLLVLRKPS